MSTQQQTTHRSQIMLNFPNEPQKAQLHKIIQEYLIINQQTENAFISSVQLAESAFLNQWKQLNQQRLHNQNANWSNFLHKLQQLNAIQSVTNNTNQYNNHHQSLLPHQPPIANTVKSLSLSVPSSIPSSPTPKPKTKLTIAMNSGNPSIDNTSKAFKSTEQFVCRIKGCSKRYTTKGNLNRHLKDFHRLNPDLTPIPTDDAHIKANARKKNKNAVNATGDHDECSQMFVDNMALTNQHISAHASFSQFHCIHSQCGEHQGFNTVLNIKAHGVHTHNIGEDQISEYIANCKQAAVRRNTAMTASSLSSCHTSSGPPSVAPASVAPLQALQKRKRPNFIHKNAFNSADAPKNDIQLNMLMTLKNSMNNAHNPFAGHSPVQTQTNNNGFAPALPAFILNKNNHPLHVPMVNFAANHQNNKLNVQHPLALLNNNTMNQSVNAAQMNRMNQMNMNSMLMHKQNVNMNGIPVPMLQILTNNGNNNALNATLMQISAMNGMNNNNKMNGMKSLIAEILKKNHTVNHNHMHTNNLNTFNRIQTVPGLVGNINAYNTMQSVDNNSNMNANINVKNDDKKKKKKKKNTASISPKYDGLNVLLQAVDALDQDEEDDGNGNGNDDNKSKKSKKQIKCSRKRKIEKDYEYKAPNMHSVKRRKLSNEDSRLQMQSDATFTKQNHLNEHIQETHNE